MSVAFAPGLVAPIAVVTTPPVTVPPTVMTPMAMPPAMVAPMAMVTPPTAAFVAFGRFPATRLKDNAALFAFQRRNTGRNGSGARLRGEPPNCKGHLEGTRDERK